MTNLLHCRPTCVLAWVTAWILSAVAAFGQSVTVTNYTAPGYIIDSQKNAIAARASFSRVAFSNEPTTLTFRLLDPDNQPVNLQNDSGNPVAFISVNYTVVPGTSSNVVTALLRPHDTLKGGVPYRVSVFIGIIGQTVVDSNAYTYVHFQDDGAPATRRHAVAVVGQPSIVTPSIFNGITNRNGLLVDIPYTVYRYDTNGVTERIPLIFSAAFVDDLGNATNPVNFLIATNSLFMPTGMLSQASSSIQVRLRPAAQLDPVNRTYGVRIGVTHEEDPDIKLFRTGNTATSTSQRVLHFNSTLIIGGVTSTVTSVTNNPVVASVTNTHVNSTLQLGPAGAFFPGATNYVIDSNLSIPVRLFSNGVAESVAAGEWAVRSRTPGQREDWSNITVKLDDLYINNSGLYAGSLRAGLPVGSGYADDDDSQLLNAHLVFNNIALNGSMFPISATVSRAGLFYVSEETKPFRMRANHVTYNPAQGRFEWDLEGAPVFVREEALALLAANVDAAKANDSWIAGDRFRRSNDSYYRYLNGYGAFPLLVTQVSTNGTALTSVNVTFSANAIFRTAFPYDIAMEWKGANTQLSFVDDLVDVAKSAIDQPQPVTIRYATGCPGGGCPDEDSSELIFFSAPALPLFTTDGGIYLGSGTVNAPLNWNLIGEMDYVHNITSHFTKGNFYMPGHFARGENADDFPFRVPAAMLLSGLLTNTLQQYENPFGEGYFDGRGDYAGLNLRVAGNGPSFALSTIGGVQMGQAYKLSTRSKYYVRYSGVSGIHEAEAVAFPGSATIYGYPVTFTNFSLSYLSGRNIDTRTRGSIAVPYPSAFTQRFERLTLTCRGDLDQARIPDDARSMYLSYWAADASLNAMSFARNQDCNAGTGFLTLGLSMRAAYLNGWMRGVIGFKPNGNLIARADGVGGVDSRLRISNTQRFSGPNSETWRLQPVAPAYLNDYSRSPIGLREPGDGWVNIAGLLDAAFFEDIEVHLMTGLRAEAMPRMYLAGGWKSGRGWKENGKHIFNDVDFDAQNAGYPAPRTEAGLANYRENLRDYRPTARQRWLDILGFDTPLSWRPLDRYFASYLPLESTDLILFDIENHVDYLSPLHANISFGGSYKQALKLDVQSILGNVINEALGINVGDFFSGSLGTNAVGDIQYVSLVNGMQGLGFMINMGSSIWQETMRLVIDPRINSFLNDLADLVEADATEAEVEQFVHDFCYGQGDEANRTIKFVIARAMDGSAYATNALTTLRRVVDDVIYMVDNLVEGVRFNTNGVPVGTEAVRGLLRFDGENLVNPFADLGAIAGGMVADFLPDTLKDIVKPIDKAIKRQIPALFNARKTLVDQRNTLTNLIHDLDSNGPYTRALQSAISEEDINDLTAALYDAIMVVVSNNYAVNRALSPAERDAQRSTVVATLRAWFTSIFISTYIGNEYTTHAPSQIQNALATTFQSLEDVVNSVITDINDFVEKKVEPMLGKIGDKVEAGTLRGHAHIDNDLLRELFITGQFVLKKPDNGRMETSGLLSYRPERASEDGTCSFAGEKTHVIRLATYGVPIQLSSDEYRGVLLGKIDGLFAFETSPYRAVGIKGGLDSYAGTLLAYEGLNVRDIIGRFAFGGDEAYVAGQAEAYFSLADLVTSYNDYLGGTRALFEAYLNLVDETDPPVLRDLHAMGGIPAVLAAVALQYAEGGLILADLLTGLRFTLSGGMFLGRSCDLNVIRNINDEVARAHNTVPYTGGLGKFGAYVEVTRLGCLANIGGGFELGWIALGSEDVRTSLGLYGAVAAHGEILCLVHAAARVQLTPLGSSLGGSARLSGRVGHCPFCLEGSIRLGIILRADSFPDAFVEF